MLLNYFDKYVGVGLKPIAIYKDTKCPIGEEWNKNWTSERWRPFFLEENYNIGILLGDIVDVEGDTEEANRFLSSLIGDVPHPQFSSSKSIHHLFLTPDPRLTRFAYNDIEFRGLRHQSVVPPSVHIDGARYRWLANSKMPIPAMPEKLIQFYFDNIDKSKRIDVDPIKKLKARKKEGFKRTECRICNKLFYIHKKRLTLEVKGFREYNLPWMCHSCREFDMRNMCRSIRKQEKLAQLVF